MRKSLFTLIIALLLCGCGARSDAAAIKRIYELAGEAEDNPAVVYVPAWNKEWTDTWDRVYQSTDSEDLRQAAAWCIAFAQTKAVADMNVCTMYIKRHNDKSATPAQTPRPTPTRSAGAYVTTESTVVFPAPDAKLPGTCNLPSRAKVTVHEWRNGFARITGDPCSGWVRGISIWPER
jgi:hypothetical protein